MGARKTRNDRRLVGICGNVQRYQGELWRGVEIDIIRKKFNQHGPKLTTVGMKEGGEQRKGQGGKAGVHEPRHWRKMVRKWEKPDAD